MLSDVQSGRLVLDCSHLSPVSGYTLSADHMAQEGGLPSQQLRICWVKPQPGLLNGSEDLAQLGEYSVNVIGVQQVIRVHNTMDAKNIHEHSLHHFLMCHWSIAESKWHDSEP